MSRNKSKDNLYTLNIDNNIYTVTFVDNKKSFHKVEISENVYSAFDKFELEDISQIHKFRSHIEHFELSDEMLNDRIFYPQLSVEEIVEQKIMIEELNTAIDNLSTVQKRCIKMYYFENMKLREIALLEHCSIASVKESIDSALLLQKN